MKLSALEKQLLRIVAQDGDFERLDLVLSQLKEHLPDGSEEQALEAAKTALRGLISKGLVELYRREFAEGAKYEPLSREEYDGTLNKRNCWFWSEEGMEDIGAAPTEVGQRIYEAG